MQNTVEIEPYTDLRIEDAIIREFKKKMKKNCDMEKETKIITYLIILLFVNIVSLFILGIM